MRAALGHCRPSSCLRRDSSCPEEVLFLFFSFVMAVGFHLTGVASQCPALNTSMISNGNATVVPFSSTLPVSVYTPGDVIRYQCDLNYFIFLDVVSQAMSTFSVLCMGDGTWTNNVTQAPTCQSVICQSPFPAVDRNLIVSDNITTPPVSRFPYMTAAALRCRGGYHVNGSANTVTTKVAVCQATGLWNDETFPGCELVDCGDPAELFQNVNVSGDRFVVFARVTLTCFSGYYINGDVSAGSILSVKCTESGLWSPVLPGCALPPTSSPTIPASSASTSSSLSDTASTSTDSGLSAATPLPTVSIVPEVATNASVAAADSGPGTGILVAIITLSCLGLLAICVSIVYVAKKKWISERRWKNLPVIFNMTESTSRNNSRPHMSLSLQENGRSSSTGLNGTLANAPSQVFDDPIYGTGRYTTVSFDGTETGYGRQQANQVYSSPVSPARSSLDLPSPPLDHSTPISATAADPQSAQAQAAAVGGQSSNGGTDSSRDTQTQPLSASEQNAYSCDPSAEAAMALYNRPVPNSPQLYQEVRDERSNLPSATSPYATIAGDTEVGDFGDVPTPGQNVYNTVRNPPVRKMPDQASSLDEPAGAVMAASPVYYCLEEVSAPGDIRSSLDAGSHTDTTGCSDTNRRTPSPADADTRRLLLNGGKSHPQYVSIPDSPSHLYSKPMKDGRPTGIGTILSPLPPPDRTGKVGSKAKARTVQELDIVSSNAASMLRRRRSHSMSAAERREKRLRQREQLLQDGAAYDSEPSHGDRRLFPFPPPPRKDSLAAGLRTVPVSGLRKASTGVNRTRSKSMPRPILRRDPKPNLPNLPPATDAKPGGGLPIVDQNLLELTTDL